jgi:hypothetical protein
MAGSGVAGLLKSTQQPVGSGGSLAAPPARPSKTAARPPPADDDVRLAPEVRWFLLSYLLGFLTLLFGAAAYLFG